MAYIPLSIIQNPFTISDAANPISDAANRILENYRIAQRANGVDIYSIFQTVERCKSFIKEQPKGSKDGLLFGLNDEIDVTSLPGGGLLDQVVYFNLENAVNLNNLDALLGTTKLESLQIDKSSLDSIPEEIIKNNPNLTNIRIVHGKLTGIPDDVCNLAFLKTLNLNNNKLESLPEKIGDLNNTLTIQADNSFLSRLIIGKNELKSLPESIKELTQWYIEIDKNSFSNFDKIDEDTKKIYFALKENNKNLLIAYQEQHPNEFKRLPQDMKNLTNIV